MSAPAAVIETPKAAARRLAAGAIRDGFKPEALHVYCDAAGAPLFWRIRCKHPDGRKWIRPMRANGQGFELGEPEHPPEGRPLYRLPELLADPSAPVWIVEGETCADALAKCGLVASTSGSADSAGGADWSPLKGRRCVLWPDHDAAGAKYAEAVADRLRALGGAVEVIDVAQLGLPEKGDCVDWLAQHPGTIAADLDALPRVEPSARSDAEPDRAELARLAALDPLAYDRERRDAAKRLGCRPATLDALVAALRAADADAGGAGRRLPFDETEPWPEAVDAAQVLDAAHALIARHVVAESHTLHAATLWAAMTWFPEHASVLPLAVITAPEKGCGKSTLLGAIGRLSRRALPASNISPSALFRSIEAWSPTLLIDESDSFARDNEELRGILNSGHTRETAQVIRAIEVAGEFEPRVFSTWGPKALAGIGHLPETIMARAVVLTLRRALPGERVENLRHADRAPFDAVRRKFARWAEEAGPVFATLRPLLPELANRAADNWEPLFALAELAGGEWPERARQAARALFDVEQDATSVGEELLSDIRAAFERTDRLSSEALLERLTANPEAPWATWNRGKPMTARQLARRLGDFGIRPNTVRLGDRTPKGYRRDQFEDVFARYLPAPPCIRNTATSLVPQRFQRFRIRNNGPRCCGSKIAETRAVAALWRCCGSRTPRGGKTKFRRRRGGAGTVNAVEVLTEAEALGIRVSAHGDRLRLEAPKGRITPELVERLRQHKPDVLAWLGGQRARLERLAAEAGLPGDLVQRLPADEIAACAPYSDRLLTVYLRALDRRIGAGPFHPTRRSTAQ